MLELLVFWSVISAIGFVFASVAVFIICFPMEALFTVIGLMAIGVGAFLGEGIGYIAIKLHKKFFK